MEIDWIKARNAARYVQVTEQVPIDGDDTELRKKVKDLDLNYICPVYGRELASVFYAHLGAQTLYGYVASAGNLLIVALRCTETTLEAMHDMSFLSVPNPTKGNRGWVEAGFSAIYQSLTVGNKVLLHDKIKALLATKQFSRVQVCGHSLGGPLVTLLAFDLAAQCPDTRLAAYTFGSPRVGGKVFALFYNAAVPETYRIVVRNDLVQYVPILPAYYHVDTRFELVPKEKTIDPMNPLCMHHISTYLYLIDELIGGNSPLDEDCKYCSMWQKFKNLFKRKKKDV